MNAVKKYMPNPAKGLFYIDIPDYKGPIIMKISDASGKLLETHHLVYSGLMSWRLSEGIYTINFKLDTLISTVEREETLIIKK